MRTIDGLTWRGLNSARLRTLLMIFAVSFGVATPIAGSVIAESAGRAILATDELRELMGGLIEQINPLMIATGLIVTAVSGFLIWNAFSMAITQRRQQIGGLRALGMTRRQIMRLTLLEGVVIAAVGVVLGLAAGPLLGLGVVALIKQFGGGLFAFEEAAPQMWSILLGVGLGSGITLLAVWFPARRAAQIAPLDALRQPEAAGIEAHPARRTSIGLLVVCGITGHLLLSPPGVWIQPPLDFVMTVLFGLLWLVGLLLLLPGVIGLIASLFTRFSTTFVGRLTGDNLRRARGRATATALTMALALLSITAISGFFEFFLNHILLKSLDAGIERNAGFISRLDITSGWTNILASGLDQFALNADELAAIESAAEGIADASPIIFVTVPELSMMGSGFFSYMIEPETMRTLGNVMFDFTEGSWDSAMPILEAGCGVLVSPQVAARFGADIGIGDTISVTGREGPVNCTIAGLGTGVMGVSIISGAALDQFPAGRPLNVVLVPRFGVNDATFQAQFEALTAEYPNLHLTLFRGLMNVQRDAMGVVINAFSGMLLLAVLGAALGVVNTTMMSISERRREIGLLRAVGTTRRQTRRILLGEAALMGLIGGAVGVVGGAGFAVILAMTYGGNGFGVEMDLAATALTSAGAALRIGLVGLAAAPIIAALAAWLPARTVLRQTPLEALALR